MTTTEAEIDYKAREHQWAEALREPGRLQCSGQLGRAQGGVIYEQCCLDVACELAGVPWKIKAPRTVVRFDIDAVETESGLTAEAMAWLGVNSSDPAIDWPEPEWRSQGCDDACRVHDYDDECRWPDNLKPTASCAQLNDDWGLTFAQIADLVAYFGLVRP